MRIRLIIFSILLSALLGAKERPHVLLLAVDDLNDWIGCMGGHPQAQTPNMDRLAAEGVFFTNAHCQSPVCNPSRASMMTALYPSTSGVYFLNPDLKASPVATQQTLLPARFQKEGYHVTGAGKLFHGNQNESYVPLYGGSFGGFGPLPQKRLSSFTGHPLWDWGVFPEQDAEMPDHKIASWGAQVLQQNYDKPLFLGIGFYRPHVPQFAPQKWFDLYPLESLQLPKAYVEDLDDLSEYAHNLQRRTHVSPSYEWVVKNDEWKPLVQSYLACVSFVDHQVGRVLEALEESEKEENTYIVLCSDHGFHLGEKERLAKRSLWEESTRVPLIIVGPGVKKGVVCEKPVQLLDIYPTLLELVGLAADSKLEGNSLKPLLENPEAEWPHMARTAMGPGNYAIRSERYRYIRYNDGSEEFYDHESDPYEWKNLAGENTVEKVMAEHRSHIPESWHPILGKGSTGHKAYGKSEAVKNKE